MQAGRQAGRLPRQQAPRTAQRQRTTKPQRLRAAGEVREDVRDEGDDLSRVGRGQQAVTRERTGRIEERRRLEQSQRERENHISAKTTSTRKKKHIKFNKKEKNTSTTSRSRQKNPIPQKNAYTPARSRPQASRNTTAARAQSRA